jgi:hypothetical protein
MSEGLRIANQQQQSEPEENIKGKKLVNLHYFELFHCHRHEFLLTTT